MIKLPQNIYNAQLKTLYELHLSGQRPSLLLHACCGPCASSVLVQLYDFFDITIFYSNSNIYPDKEYERRLAELKAFLPRFNQNYHANVKLVEDIYDPQSALKILAPYAKDKEGGHRCQLCYEMRIRRAMAYAKKNHFDYCTTVLTLSRLKNSRVINEIALKVSEDFPEVNYFVSDFKKNKGIDLSIDLTTMYDMYRQDYCGCIFSYHKNSESNQ